MYVPIWFVIAIILILLYLMARIVQLSTYIRKLKKVIYILEGEEDRIEEEPRDDGGDGEG